MFFRKRPFTQLASVLANSFPTTMKDQSYLQSFSDCFKNLLLHKFRYPISAQYHNFRKEKLFSGEAPAPEGRETIQTLKQIDCDLLDLKLACSYNLCNIFCLE